MGALVGEKPEDPPPGEVAGLRVLVVDDDIFMRDVVCASLANLGVEQVAAAADGMEGVQSISHFRPDVVICDLNMPGMDGVEFLRHLAERSFLGGVLLFSGEDELILRTTEDLVREHGLNLLGALSKPVSSDELGRILLGFQSDKSSPFGAVQRVYLKEELRRAIVNNEVVPYFQPQVDTRTGRCIGVEALARWLHPEDGLVGPALFVPLAEQTGLITALTESIFRQSVQAAFRFHTYVPGVRLSVNLSTLALQRTWLPDMLTEQAESYGVPPSRITLEVTETNVIDNLALSLEVLTRLRLRGFGLAIDDFGTGYASMQQLRKIPFTELKIDKSFVHGGDSGGSSDAMLESSVALGLRMDLSVVAEGVETQAEWDRVVSLGCNVVQGWFVAKAMPEDDLAEWLHEDQRRPSVPVAAASGSWLTDEDAAPRVLVVDDSDFHGAATARILNNLGAEATVASSGREAIHRLSAEQFELVLMDIEMPGMDGYEAARQIRRFAPVTTVVGQSGTVDDRAKRVATDAGLAVLVEKRFDLGALRDILERYAVRGAHDGAEPEVGSRAPLPPALDLSLLAAATGLDPDTLYRLAGRAVADIESAAVQLRQCVDTGDLRQCRLVAHRAKSSARAIGAEGLQQVLSTIESGGDGQPMSVVKGYIDRMFEQLARVKTAYAQLP
jgi:EAL domain-containing protein (putative c-di-GMP-specific phosphodiesterase class I)/DNA-binding response OmpR family regulator/HPt (histidine-containing phosphotransfer) domain-containing protein